MKVQVFGFPTVRCLIIGDCQKEIATSSGRVLDCFHSMPPTFLSFLVNYGGLQPPTTNQPPSSLIDFRTAVFTQLIVHARLPLKYGRATWQLRACSHWLVLPHLSAIVFLLARLPGECGWSECNRAAQYYYKYGFAIHALHLLVDFRVNFLRCKLLVSQ